MSLLMFPKFLIPFPLELTIDANSRKAVSTTAPFHSASHGTPQKQCLAHPKYITKKYSINLTDEV